MDLERVNLLDESVFATSGGLWTGKKGPFVGATVIRSTNFTASGRVDYSNVAVLQVEERQLARRRLNTGDIIIERSGGGPTQPVGRVVFFERDDGIFSHSNFTSRLRVIDTSRFEPRFVFYFLLHFYDSGCTDHLQRRTTGIRNLDWRAYREAAAVPLFELREQRQIAGALSAVQRAIERQERLSALTAELKRALMHKLFTEGTRGEALKQTAFGVVPQSWEVCTLGDLRSMSERRAIVSGPFGSNIGKRFFLESGVPLIRGCNLTKGEAFLVEKGFVFISEEKANELSGCIAIAGDLVFTAAGTLGQVGLIPPISLFPKYVISNKQLRARLDEARVRPEFVFHWFASDTIQALIEQRRGGASIPVINLSILKALPVPVPSLEEQDHIVEVLAAVQRKREKHQEHVRSLTCLFRALLQQLMTGQIRARSLDISELEELEQPMVGAA